MIERPDRRTITIALIALVVVASGIGIAQTFLLTAGQGTTIDNPNGASVTLGEDLGLSGSNPQNPDGSITVQETTIDGPQGSSATLTNPSTSAPSLTSVNTNGGTITAETDGIQTVDISGGVTALTYRDVDLSSSSTEFETSGSGTVGVHGFSSGEAVRVEFADGSATLETADSSGVVSVSVNGNDFSIVETSGGLSITDPSPTGGVVLDEEPIELSVNVQHGDFSAGEEVDVTFTLNGNDINTKTVTSNGTVNVSTTAAESGTNEWSVTASDTQGTTESIGPFEFATPNTLYIRNEANPNELVNDTSSSIEVRFINNGEVYSRSTDDGKIDLSGLPANEEFVVETEADGYITRQTLIRGIIDQQSVYLLPNTTDSVETQFIVSDPTGQVNTENSRILVKKPIELNGSVDYRTIVADLSGTGGFSTLLEQDQRYLIEVEDTESGDIRELGPYVATSARVVELEIDEIEYEFKPGDAGYSWGATYVNQSDGNRVIDINFAPSDGWTASEVTFEVTDKENGTVVYQQTFTEVSGQLSVTADLPDVENPASKSYEVSWEATLVDPEGNEETVSDVTTAGQSQNPIDVDGVPEEMLSLVGILAVLAVGGLFSAANVGVGGVVTALTAGGLWVIGILPEEVSGGFIVIALFVAVLYHIQQSGPAVPNR